MYSDLASQRVETRLNGQLVQDQPISDMIWDIAFLIEYCSTFTPLAPGDVIVTGTPAFCSLVPMVCTTVANGSAGGSGGCSGLRESSTITITMKMNSRPIIKSLAEAM